jgi:protocatechuate 3,4-dioxygenase beta subunit
MSQFAENRRDFLQRAALAALAFPFLLSCKSSTLAQKTETGILSRIRKNAVPFDGEWNGAKDAPVDVSRSAVLSKKTGEGEPIIISGTVFAAEGGLPAPNILIYLYHTDTEGFYGRKNGEHRHGRFRGWLLTDDKGRYEFRTIKAAPYPQNRSAAHIHMTLTGADFKEDWIDSILFEGDRLISAREREAAGKKGGFNPILKLARGADGALRGTRDIRLWKM